MRDDPLMERILSSGEIRIGFQRHTPPFSYAAANAPWPSGYCVALASEAMDVLACSLGVPLRIHPVEVTSTTRTGMLLQGEIDIECGSTTITAERQRRVAFSRPIFHTAHRVALKAGRSLHDAHPIHVTGIGESTSHRALLDASRTFAPTRVMRFAGRPSIGEAFDAFLHDDDIDAIVADEVILAGLLSGAGASGVTMVEPRIGGEYYGFMMRLCDTAFQQAIDRALSAVMDAPGFVQSYASWFERPLAGLGFSLGLNFRLQRKHLIQPADASAPGTL